ncbi:MAG: glucose-6-phosphate dehydrogenase, partial [Pseudomonadota bacterium]
MVSRVIPVDPFDLVLFGATGDLAQRKILPGLYHRFEVGQMPEDARIIGTARSDMTADGFRDQVRAAMKDYAPSHRPDTLDRFLSRVEYVSVDAMGDAGWADLVQSLRPDVVRAFYLSVGPSLFSGIAQRLHDHELATSDSRIVVEKPFGHDLASAKALNEGLRTCFQEHQIYRIDHYLGKETVQNLMALRFANSLFEPLWNSTHVDHVQ